MVDKPEKKHWLHEKLDTKQEIITITLWPYRSLSSRGYLYVMIVFIGLISTLSLLFFYLGAWPVIGFLGIEIGLVWLVFRLNYKAGRNFEKISITPEATSIEKVGWRGDSHYLTIPSPWVKAWCKKENGRSDRLILSYHSSHLEIGSFLPTKEKSSLADALNESFKRMRGLA